MKYNVTFVDLNSAAREDDAETYPVKIREIVKNEAQHGNYVVFVDVIKSQGQHEFATRAYEKVLREVENGLVAFIDMKGNGFMCHLDGVTGHKEFVIQKIDSSHYPFNGLAYNHCSHIGYSLEKVDFYRAIAKIIKYYETINHPLIKWTTRTGWVKIPQMIMSWHASDLLVDLVPGQCLIVGDKVTHMSLFQLTKNWIKTHPSQPQCQFIETGDTYNAQDVANRSGWNRPRE